MILQEIGRFGDSIEELELTDVLDKIPQWAKRSYIGIFWHLGNNEWIIYKARLTDPEFIGVDEGQGYDDNPEDINLNYNRFHMDVWNEYWKRKDQYKNVPFDTYSRGRVLFDLLQQKFILYIPDKLDFAIPQLLTEFNIDNSKVIVDSKIYKAKKDADNVQGDFKKV